MKIRNYLAILLLILLCGTVFSQEIDLLEKADKARWTNIDGQTLIFGRDLREQGTVKFEQGMQLEDGKSYPKVLFIHPPWKPNGAVYGGFDNVTVPEKDPKLVLTAGFNQGALGTDGVTVAVRFLHAGSREGAEERRMRATSQLGSPSQSLQTLELRYDRQLKRSEMDLDAFAGQTGTLMLVVNAGRSADKDWTVLTELKIVSGETAGDRPKQVVKNLTGHRGRLYAARFSPDGKFVVTGSADTTARIWEVPSGRLRSTLQGHTAHIFAVDVSPDSRRIVTGSGDGTAAVWRAAGGGRLLELRGHSQGVLCVAFNPDGNRIATGSDDGTVKLWRVSDGNEIKTLQVASGGIYALRFHPQGRLLAVGSTNGGLAIWNTENGRQVRALQGHRRAVSSLAFAQGGNRLVSASVDKSAKIWNANQGRLLHNLSGGKSYYAASFFPNGRYVITGDEGQAHIWGTAQGKKLMTIRHISETPVRAVDVHPNGRWVVLAGEDGSARIWEIELE